MSEPEQLTIPGFERALKDANEYHTFTKGLSGESPRAVVLITMCALDSLLDKLLRLRLDTAEMNSDQKSDLRAALKSFTSKVALAQGLGLVGKIEAKSLIALNDVRNKFAHAWNASFDSENVLMSIDKLPIQFSDKQDKKRDEQAYDKFRYSVAAMLRDIIARCSLLEESGEVSAFSLGLKLNRKHVSVW